MNIAKLSPIIIYQQYPSVFKVVEDKGTASVYEINHPNVNYYPRNIVIERVIYNRIDNNISVKNSWAIYERQILEIDLT